MALHKDPGLQPKDEDQSPPNTTVQDQRVSISLHTSVRPNNSISKSNTQGHILFSPFHPSITLIAATIQLKQVRYVGSCRKKWFKINTAETIVNPAYKVRQYQFGSFAFVPVFTCQPVCNPQTHWNILSTCVVVVVNILFLPFLIYCYIPFMIHDTAHV